MKPIKMHHMTATTITLYDKVFLFTITLPKPGGPHKDKASEKKPYLTCSPRIHKWISYQQASVKSGSETLASWSQHRLLGQKKASQTNHTPPVRVSYVINSKLSYQKLPVKEELAFIHKMANAWGC